MDNSVDKRFPRERQARWDKANLVTVSTHLRLDEAADWRHACFVAGRSPYAVLQDMVRTFVRDILGGPPLSPA